MTDEAAWVPGDVLEAVPDGVVTESRFYWLMRKLPRRTTATPADWMVEPLETWSNDGFITMDESWHEYGIKGPPLHVVGRPVRATWIDGQWHVRHGHFSYTLTGPPITDLTLMYTVHFYH